MDVSTFSTLAVDAMNAIGFKGLVAFAIGWHLPQAPWAGWLQGKIMTAVKGAWNAVTGGTTPPASS